MDDRCGGEIRVRRMFVLVASFAIVLSTVVTTTLGFSACGVIFGTPAYELKTRSGQRLLYVDLNGNLYIGSSQVNMGLSYLSPISSWSNALILVYEGSPVIAISPSEANLLGKIVGNYVPATVSEDLVIKRSTGDVLAVLSHTGDIYSRGTAVYQGGQAGCPAGWYCDISSGTCECTDECTLGDWECLLGCAGYPYLYTLKECDTNGDDDPCTEWVIQCVLSCPE